MQLKYWLSVAKVEQHAVTEALGTTLNEYEHLRTSKDKGTAFQQFHAKWEVLQNVLNDSKLPSFIEHAYYSLPDLKSLLLQRQFQPNTIWYRIAHLLTQKWVRFSKSIKSDFVSIDTTMSQEEDYAHLPQDDRTQRWMDTVRFNYVFLQEDPNFPGIDIVSFFKNTKGEVFALIEQNKTAYVKGSELSSSDVKSRSFIINQFNNLFPNHGIPDKNIIYSVVVFKNVPDSVAATLYAELGVDVVVGMKQLRKSFGPSFENLEWLLHE